MYIYEKRGFIYVKNPSINDVWLTSDYSPEEDAYFLLNTYTKKKFIEDIYPLIQQGKCTIDNNLLKQILSYTAIEENLNPSAIQNLQGITYKKHQEQALELMSKYNRYGFFLGTGTGKTIIAMGFLLSNNIPTALIVTPVKVVAQYEEELEKYFPKGKYEVTNYEKLSKYIDKEYDTLILDESHRAKNCSSNINQYCCCIAKKCKHVYLFTGTPEDSHKSEILAQIKILDERVMPTKTKTFFRYFNQDDYYQPSTTKREHLEELNQVIKDYTWGKQTKEVVALTKSNNFVIRCTNVSSLYNTLMIKRVLKYKDWYCVADNKAILKIKLREICDGFAKLSNNKLEEKIVRIFTPKKKALEQLINQVSKGIIYYEFTDNLTVITQVLANKKYAIINGLTKKSQVKKAIEDFKQDTIQYLVMQNKSGGAGLDLTTTNNMIFYSLPESYITFTQCRGRINRIGQKKECNYWHIICKDTVEEQILKSLRKKKSFNTKLFKLIK